MTKKEIWLWKKIYVVIKESVCRDVVFDFESKIIAVKNSPNTASKIVDTIAKDKNLLADTTIIMNDVNTRKITFIEEKDDLEYITSF